MTTDNIPAHYFDCDILYSLGDRDCDCTASEDIKRLAADAGEVLALREQVEQLEQERDDLVDRLDRAGDSLHELGFDLADARDRATTAEAERDRLLQVIAAVKAERKREFREMMRLVAALVTEAGGELRVKAFTLTVLDDATVLKRYDDPSTDEVVFRVDTPTPTEEQ